MDDLGAAYLALEKRVGRTAPAIPGPEATDEQRAEFFNALGRPEAADNYAIRAKIKEVLPERFPVDERFVKAAFETFHKAGLNDAQADAVVRLFAQQQEIELLAEDVRTLDTMRALKSQWGKDLEKQLAVGTAAINKLSRDIPGLRALAANPLYGNNVVLVRLVNSLGRLMDLDGASPPTQDSDLQARKQELMKRDGPYWNSLHAEHGRHVAAVARINDQLARRSSARR